MFCPMILCWDDSPHRVCGYVLIKLRQLNNRCILMVILASGAPLRSYSLELHSHTQICALWAHMKQLQAYWCISLAPTPPPTKPPRAQISYCSEHLLSSSQQIEERRQRGGNQRWEQEGRRSILGQNNMGVLGPSNPFQTLQQRLIHSSIQHLLMFVIAMYNPLLSIRGGM